MTETASHEKLTETPHQWEAALIKASWRFEYVITENLAAYQSSQQSGLHEQLTRFYNFCARGNLRLFACLLENSAKEMDITFKKFLQIALFSKARAHISLPNITLPSESTNQVRIKTIKQHSWNSGPIIPVETYRFRNG